MVLLEDVVHVLRPTASATTSQRSGLFQIRHRGWVRRVPIDINDARLDAAGLCDGKLENALCGNEVAVWREQEIDCVPGGVDGPIQIGPLASHANVGFIDS